jgi:uncharacterized protein (TIGR02145 family)
MKTRISIWTYPLTFAALALFLFFSCKKDNSDTDPPQDNGSVTDIDGNVYQTVKIGKQVWMAENLKVTKYRNGDSIPDETITNAWGSLRTGAYCNAIRWEINGRLYNWYAADDSRNLAPVGWHIPSDAEWTTLTTFLGGLSVAGGKLKEKGLTNWRTPNAGANNSSGFTALPGGIRSSDGSFNNIGALGYWLTSTSYDLNNAWYRLMSCNDSTVIRGSFSKYYGYSVRCVKDSTVVKLLK